MEGEDERNPYTPYDEEGGIDANVRDLKSYDFFKNVS
jgi:hypothetical protein